LHKTVNTSKIESLPSRHKAWEYVFFVDFNGHLADEKVQAALPVIEERSVFLKVLGSYPIAHTATKN
jgi:chorismate mutase/prephenate dehydratase